MKRILNIPIPFEYIKGRATVSQVQQMSEMQKRISAMIICHEDLKISEMTMTEAVEQVFGIQKINQILIKKEILELIDQNCKNAKYIDEDTRLALIAFSFNKDIKEKIVKSNKFQLITSSKEIIWKEALLPLFDHFKIDYEINSKTEKNLSIKFDQEISSVSDDEKIDILSVKFHEDLKADEVVEKEELTDSKTTVWKKYNFKINIENGKLVSTTSTGEEILDLINTNKILFNVEKYLNCFADKTLFREFTGEDISMEELKKLVIHRINNYPNPILISEKQIKEFGYRKVMANLTDQNLTIKQPVFKKYDLLDFVKRYPTTVDKNFISLIANYDFLIVYIYNNSIKTSIEEKQLIEYLNIDIFNELSEQAIKKICKDPFQFSVLNSKLINQLSKQAIIKIQRLANISFEKMIDLFCIQYDEKRIFEGWNKEESFFKALEKIKSVLLKKDILKKDLEIFRQELFMLVDDIFQNQKIFKKRLKELDKAIFNASEWSEDTIISKAVKTRTNLEEEINKIDKTKKSFGEKVAKNIVANKANILKRIYKELSNDYVHKKLDDRKKSEQQLKEIMKKLEEILPLTEKDKKKEKK